MKYTHDAQCFQLRNPGSMHEETYKQCRKAMQRKIIAHHSKNTCDVTATLFPGLGSRNGVNL